MEGTSANSLDLPYGVAVAPDGSLYVADKSNNRVLHYSGTSTTADRVYGQGAAGNDFAAYVSNNDGSRTGSSAVSGSPSATNMFYPYGVALASDGSLYVADQNNYRALYYPATAGVPAFTATRVYGQGAAGNNFSASNAPNPPSATSMSYAYGVAVAPDGSLYVVDSGNNRALHFPAYSNGSPLNFTADKVYGQGAAGNDFAARIAPSPPSATSMNAPLGLAVDASGTLYVADRSNNRVLHYGFSATQVGFTTQPVGAKPGEFLTTQPVVAVKDANGNTVTTYNGNVTVAIKSGTAGAVLGGTTTVTAVNGVATFTDLTIDLAGTGYVLTASATDLTSADSEPFDVSSDFVPVAHASDLVPQLRVSPDSVVSTNPENLVSFAFKVKNIGKGEAGRIVISLPIPQGLDVGYLAEGASAGVWVTQVTTATVTLTLPKLEEGKEASGVLVFRPNANAVAGTQVESRYTLTFDDPTRSGKSLNSNTQSFAFGEANSDESLGAIQRGAAVSAIAGEKVSITQTGYLADELVALWYTAPSGTTVSLGMHRANTDGVVSFVLDTAGVAAGDYAVVGYGNRSEVTHVNILTVAAS